MGASRVLVTGATGFVGAALVRELRRTGVDVLAVGRRDAVHASGGRGLQIADIGPATDWGNALVGCDAVVHLAARVHQLHERASDPLREFMRVNCDGTQHLARQAAAAGVSRFVFVSSIKVNGEATTPGSSFSERDCPAPADAYGASKAAGEAAVRAVAVATGMQVTIVRPPLVYGPGVRANFLSMTKWLARGVPLPLGGVVENRRSLVALDNLVSMLAVALRHPAAANETFLVSDGEDVSTTELLRRTARALGVTPRLLAVPPALLRFAAVIAGKGEMAQRLCGSLQVDCSKARALLDWSPPIGLDEGLRRTVAGTVDP